MGVQIRNFKESTAERKSTVFISIGQAFLYSDESIYVP